MKITWFAGVLTFGFINLTMVTTATSVGSLASKQSNSKIDHLWSSESIQERLWSLFFVCLVYMQRGTELSSGRSEDQKRSGQPSESWRNLNPWPPAANTYDIAVSFSNVVRRDVFWYFGEDGQSFEFFYLFFLIEQRCGLPRGDPSFRSFLANGR